MGYMKKNVLLQFFSKFTHKIFHHFVVFQQDFTSALVLSIMFHPNHINVTRNRSTPDLFLMQHCSGTYGKAVEPPTSHNRTTHINITHPEITTIQMSLSNNAKWEFPIGVEVRAV